MFCPYCGLDFSSDELHTSDQIEYVTEVAKEELFVHMQEQFQDILKKISGTSSNITFTPNRIQSRTVTPKYKERKLDSELDCPKCDTKFQVYGIFGYCPGCKEENLLIYDANLNIIEREIATSDNSERQLRHAYGDLVSTFENFCARKSSKIAGEKVNFQVIFDARRFFKKQINTDILSDLSPEQLLALRRLFHKRHIYIHSDGTINAKYIKNIPEDRLLIGQKAILSIEELKSAAEGMRIVLLNLVKAVETRG